MVYVPIKTCLNPYVLIEAMVMAYILVKMHLAHNKIFNVSFETQTKIHYVFLIMEILFHYNPMKLPIINHKLVDNPHYLNNIKSYTYHYIHETSNNIMKWDILHCFQTYASL
jgi:hypothetical protein